MNFIQLQSSTHGHLSLAFVVGTFAIYSLRMRLNILVAMLERHYSKLTATMAAARLG